MKLGDVVRGVRQKPLPFGGMQVILSGDLFQVFMQCG